MTPLLYALSVILSLVSFVCYVLVVIQMFQRGKTGPGLVSTLGLLACGLGALFAFIYGWIKASEWNIKNVMLTWTVCLVASIGLNVATLPAAIREAQQQAILQQQQGVPGGGLPPAPVEPAPAPAP
jgi:hypothetical protein